MTSIEPGTGRESDFPQLVMPVSGVTPDQLTDTFGAPRSGGRSHKGIDIFANRGTPAVAPVSGTITKAGNSGGLGGNRVWIQGPTGLHHYLAHLDQVSVRTGQRVSAGDPVGTVGNTGNAQSTPPHLHYSINTRNTSETGTVNPFSLLQDAQPSDSPTPQPSPSPQPQPEHEHGPTEAQQPTSPESDPDTGESIAEHIRANYGHLAWAIDHDEIGPILREAAENDWSQAKLKGSLVQTDWWAETAEAQRRWEALEGEDPATAAREVEQRVERLTQQVRQLGAPVDEDRIRDMARDSLRLGWNDAELDSAVFSYTSTFSRRQIMEREGRIAAQVDSVKRMANQDFFTPITAQQAFEHAKGLVEGTKDEETIRASLFEGAASRFPDFADRIRAGETPAQVFDPYIGLASELLEMSPGDIDPVKDSRFSSMTEFVDDDGNRRAMTLSEWGRHVRGLPEYRFTERANSQASQMAGTLMDVFRKKVV